jgi:iron-sulfur cluster assembly protein
MREVLVTTNATPAPLTIKISDEAAVHVKQFAIAEGKPDADLRVGVKGGGCSGLTYILEIVEDDPSDTDKVIEENGVKLYVDKKSYVFLAGTVLEYSGGLNGKGFVFNNPNAKTTCGCGTSFSV